MKRLISIFSVLILFCSVPFYTSANTKVHSERIISQEKEYYSDGTSAVITITEHNALPATRASSNTRIATKTYRLLNKDGKTLWEFAVKGTFSYTPGVSSVCTASSYSINIIENAWENKSATTTKSGNQCIGDATFIRKLLFSTVETKSCHVVLTCDSYGNVS